MDKEALMSPDYTHFGNSDLQVFKYLFQQSL